MLETSCGRLQYGEVAMVGVVALFSELGRDGFGIAGLRGVMC